MQTFQLNFTIIWLSHKNIRRLLICLQFIKSRICFIYWPFVRLSKFMSTRWQIVFLNICHEVYEIRTKFTTKVSASLAEKRGVNLEDLNSALMRRYLVVTWDMIAWIRSFGFYQTCRTRANERAQNIHDYLKCFIITVIVKIKNCNLFNHGALRYL